MGASFLLLLPVRLLAQCWGDARDPSNRRGVGEGGGTESGSPGQGTDPDPVSLPRLGRGSMGGTQSLALPLGKGPHHVGCADVMVGHTRQVRDGDRDGERPQGQASRHSRVAAASWVLRELSSPRTWPPPLCAVPTASPLPLSPPGALPPPLLPLPAPGRGRAAALDPTLRVLRRAGRLHPPQPVLVRAPAQRRHR